MTDEQALSAITTVATAKHTVELLRNATVPWDIYSATAAVNTITGLLDALEAALPSLEKFEEVQYSLGAYGSSRALVQVTGDTAKGIDKYVSMRVELANVDGVWELTKRG